MKRDTIEFMVGWLDALRRDDREALLATVDPGVVWQGLEDEWRCSGRDEVVGVVTAQRGEAGELDALALIGAERHAIIHARGGGALASELEDGIYNVFATTGGSRGPTTTQTANRRLGPRDWMNGPARDRPRRRARPRAS